MSSISSESPWKNYGNILVRVFSIYFLLQVLPLDWKFYRELFSINWLDLYYGDIFNIAHYQPRFLSATQTYADWGILLGIAILATALTLTIGPKKIDEKKFYYWVRVVVRYRLAIALIAYGIIKIFPLQSPFPSLSNLNTQYGEFNRWKLFSLSLGIVPSYESFLGFVEAILGIGLLYRKTASISAFLVIIFTGNVFMSNIAYEGGEAVYSFYLISLAVFVLFYDLQRLFSLLILQKPTAPAISRPVLTSLWQKRGRIILKVAVVVFFIGIYGFKANTAYREDSLQYPSNPGVPGISGIYNVSEFRLNGTPHPYSLFDSTRWQDVVFEEWNTISIRSKQPVLIDSTNTDRIYKKDSDRVYELQGSAGRHYYSYEVDSSKQILRLRNRNRNYPADTLVLEYAFVAPNQITLSGLYNGNDSLYVVLDRLHKKYLLKEVAQRGRRRGLKL